MMTTSRRRTPRLAWLFRPYYHLKYWFFRAERRERMRGGLRSGFVGVQIDGLSHAYFQLALERGYLPNIARHLRRGHIVRDYLSGLPSTTPAAQAAIFYGIETGIPAFRWFEKATGRLISCNDLDNVQYFREKVVGDQSGVLDDGSSYCNLLDGGAKRSVFTVSSPHPQTLFGRFGGLRLLVLLCLHPLRVLRMNLAVMAEYVAEYFDQRRARTKKRRPVKTGLFPLIRIICNVILRELQTFGVIADIYSGVPRIYTTYSGYDELAHQYGPASRTALINLRYTDKRIGEIMRMLRFCPGADYQLILLSDHGQTPGYPFEARFGATLGDAISGFLQENKEAVVSAGPLDFARAKFSYLHEEIEARPDSWRRRLYHRVKNTLQQRITALVPETLKVDAIGGVVVTYSSSLAHLYITGDEKRLTLAQIKRQQPLLLRFLSHHKGIGFLMARGSGARVWFVHRGGELCSDGKELPVPEQIAFLQPYGDVTKIFDQLCEFARDSSCGDLIIFGALDDGLITCFDDQIGGHGSVGGEQSHPFLILPTDHPLAQRSNLAGHAFLYHEVFLPRFQAGEKSVKDSDKRTL
jgi:hypothetical protein